MNDSRLKCGVSNEPRTRDIALEGRSVSNYTILTFIVNTHNMKCFLKISSDFENLLCFSTAFSINRYQLKKWSHQMDSNHRPIIYETIALSLSYGGIVPSVWLEHTTPSLKGMYSTRWVTTALKDEGDCSPSTFIIWNDFLEFQAINQKTSYFSWIHAWFSPRSSLT